MKKIILLLLAVYSVAVSCKKSVRQPVSYSVETETGLAPQDVYLPNTGHKYVELYVKFLTGSPTDSVTVEVTGLPAGITVNPQKSTGLPTYYYKYTYKTNNVAVGTYPVSIVATAPGTDPKTYKYNLVVIPADCATLFIGGLKGTNSCSARGYNYNATADVTGTINTMSINNFGGYGTQTNMFVTLNCEQDSVYVGSQNIGNGIIVEGKGTFTNSKMIITYTATGTVYETCTDTLSY